MTGFALLAVHQRVRKAAEVSRGDPGLRIHQNGGVKSHVVFVFLNELFEPCLLDVVFERHAQRTVVPGVGESAVDLAARIHKASALAQRNDFFHCFLSVVHIITSLDNQIYLNNFTIYPLACQGFSRQSVKF